MSFPSSLLAAFAVTLTVAGCGGHGYRNAGFEHAVAFDLQNEAAYQRSARQRGPIRSVGCDKPRAIVGGGVLVGCWITFARSGRERWFVIGADQFIVRSCASAGAALATLARSACAP